MYICIVSLEQWLGSYMECKFHTDHQILCDLSIAFFFYNSILFAHLAAEYNLVARNFKDGDIKLFSTMVRISGEPKLALRTKRSHVTEIHACWEWFVNFILNCFCSQDMFVHFIQPLLCQLTDRIFHFIISKESKNGRCTLVSSEMKSFKPLTQKWD